MHEIERVADELTSGNEDGQRARRGDKQTKPSPPQRLNCLPSQHLFSSRFNASTVHVTEG